MNAPLTALRDFSDRLSPMVVKELRHGLRTSAFATCLVLLHGLMVVALLMVPRTETAVLDAMFWGLACVVVLWLLPLRGFGAVAGEMRSSTLEMLALAGVRPFNILWGKWLSYFGQSLLVTTSLMPYIVARYHFGGSELVDEGAGLAVLILGSGLLTAMMVGFSSVKALLLRLVLTAGVLTAAGFFSAGVIGITLAPGGSLLDLFDGLALWQAVGVVAGLLLAAVYGVYVFLSFGASRILTEPDVHAVTKRRVALMIYAVLLIVGAAICVFSPDADDAAFLMGGMMLFTPLLGMDWLTEPMPVAPTALQPAWRGRGAWARRVLSPGWAGGVFCYLVVVLAPLTLIGLIAGFSSQLSLDDEVVPGFVAFLLSALVPVCLPWIRKDLFLNWVMTLLTLCMTSGLLLIMSEAADLEPLRLLGILTPVSAILCAQETYRLDDTLYIGGAISGVLWAALAVRRALAEWPVYTRLAAQLSAAPPEAVPPPHALSSPAAHDSSPTLPPA